MNVHIHNNTIPQQIKNSVAATAPGATLILYGSYARGDYNQESDIDLLVLLDKETISRDDEIKVTYPLYDIELATGMQLCYILFFSFRQQLFFKQCPLADIDIIVCILYGIGIVLCKVFFKPGGFLRYPFCEPFS